MSTLADAQTAAALIPAQTTLITNANTAIALKVSNLRADIGTNPNQIPTASQVRALLGLMDEITQHNTKVATSVTAILVQTTAIAAMS